MCLDFFQPRKYLMIVCGLNQIMSNKATISMHGCSYIVSDIKYKICVFVENL